MLSFQELRPGHWRWSWGCVQVESHLGEIVMAMKSFFLYYIDEIVDGDNDSKAQSWLWLWYNDDDKYNDIVNDIIDDNDNDVVKVDFIDDENDNDVVRYCQGLQL